MIQIMLSIFFRYHESLSSENASILKQLSHSWNLAIGIPSQKSEGKRFRDILHILALYRFSNL